MLKAILFLSLLLPSMVFASNCLVTNHIFLIHGVGGSKSTFGSMETYLNQFDECFETDSFEYDTGNSSLSTYDFAESFHALVMDAVFSGKIGKSDKISLVMHSQGGVIGSLWLNKVAHADPDLFGQVDSFITLSTPFWGADMAKLGKRIFYTLPPWLGNPISPFGRTELNEMSYGSRTIKEMGWMYQNIFPYRSLRPLAIGGYHKGGRYLAGESDVVVPIYSSRPDHYKMSTVVDLKNPYESISRASFAKTSSIPFVTVPAAHLGLDIAGVADLPKSCVETNQCSHPSIHFITQHLIGEKIKTDTTHFKNFRVLIYVNNLKQMGFEADDVILNTIDEGETKLNGSFTNRAPADLKNDQAFTLEGKVKSVGKHVIRLSVTIAGVLERALEVPVEGGHSTLINLNLTDI